MKKILVVLCALFICAGMWAQTTCPGCSIDIDADATVHNGVAPGDPAGYIDPGTGKLDVSGMAAGSLLCFNVSLTNFDFNLAGYQFQINFPANVVAFSEVAGDWNAGTGAVVVPGPVMPAAATQSLPSDDMGVLIAPTNLQNREGKFEIGELITDPGMRPAGSPGTPNAGGVIARIWIEWNPTGLATCTSGNETIRIPIGASFVDRSDDLFANDNAERVTVGNAEISVAIGDPGAFIRSNFNNDANRDSLDALGSALCALNGQASCTGWTGATANEFLQVFDYNCDGFVNSLDALPLARLCLNLQNRTASKKADYFSVSEAGVLNIDYENRIGAMASSTILLEGLKVGAPSISEAASEAGWALVHERRNGSLQYILLNLKGQNLQIPTVRFEYEPIANNAQMAIVGTANQTADFNEFKYVPQLLADNNQVRPARETFKENHKK